MPKYPLEVVRDHQDHIQELEKVIDELKDQVNDLESDMELANWDRVSTEGQLEECEKDYEIARDNAEGFDKLLRKILETLNSIVGDLNPDSQKDIRATIRLINYTL